MIALGDFNAKLGQVNGLEQNRPDTNANTPLFKSFIKTLNLAILNTLPVAKGLFTHFVERTGVPFSQSVLDYGLSDPSLTPHISSFIIDANARIECGTDHALLLATIQCKGSNSTISYKFSDIMNSKLPVNNDYSCFDNAFENHKDLPECFSFLANLM